VKKLFYLLSVLALASKGLAGTWYVDGTAGGTHNGTSWANAWTSLSQISGLSAGDIVYISGGPSGSTQTYAMSGTWAPTGGAAGNPITYQIGQDAAHNGTAVFSGSGSWFNSGSQSYLIISGNANDGRQHFATSGFGNIGLLQPSSVNVRISYVNFGQIGGGISDGNGAAALGPGFEFDHNYVFINDPAADHFSYMVFGTQQYDANIAHDNVIYVPRSESGTGADCFQWNSYGFTISNNVIVGYAPGGGYTGGQHQDGWQGLGGSYIKIINNTFQDIANYPVFGDAYFTGFSHCRVYNNIMCFTDSVLANTPPPQAGGFGLDGGYVGPVPATMTDLIVANNIAVDYVGHGVFGVGGNPSVAADFTGSYVVNNISINSGGYTSLRTGVTGLDNVFSLTQAQANLMFVKYVPFGGTNNNFHLLATALTLIQQGTNMSGYFTTDMNGNSRPTTGPWDIGACVYSTNVAVVTNIPVIQVNPGTIVYGTLPAGTSGTNSIMVQNIGTGTLSGSATVSAPFNVVSGGNYSLGAGQTQAVVVAFNPMVASNYNQSVSFSGGGGTNVMVSGSVTNGPTPPSSTIVIEKVTASTTNPVTLQFCTNLSSSTWWTAGTFSGSTNLAFTNMPVVLIRGICSNLSSSVTLTWPANPIPSVMGYKVYYGTASSTYTSSLNTGKATTATFSNLTPGRRYYFLVDTYTSLGVASPYMSETSATAPPVTSFTLTIGH
jgi:hypothetical protein